MSFSQTELSSAPSQDLSSQGWWLTRQEWLHRKSVCPWGVPTTTLSEQTKHQFLYSSSSHPAWSNRTFRNEAQCSSFITSYGSLKSFKVMRFLLSWYRTPTSNRFCFRSEFWFVFLLNQLWCFVHIGCVMRIQKRTKSTLLNVSLTNGVHTRIERNCVFFFLFLYYLLVHIYHLD